MAANDGGHLRELRALVPRLGLTGARIWVSNVNAQSRQSLAGEEVVWLRRPRSRSLPDALANAVAARRWPADCCRASADPLLQPGRPLVRPSLELSRQRLRRLQGDRHRTASAAPLVVSVGSSIVSAFPRLVAHMVELLPADASVCWQTGDTDPAVLTRLGVDGARTLDAAILERAVREADLVVCHAGTGSALMAMGAGTMPVLVPRDPTFGEHIDAHQAELADRLARGTG